LAQVDLPLPGIAERTNKSSHTKYYILCIREATRQKTKLGFESLSFLSFALESLREKELILRGDKTHWDLHFGLPPPLPEALSFKIPANPSSISFARGTNKD
jgi:hypothetical protein